MRQSFIEVNKNIYFEDGSLNFKYFNVKKGHYWSKEINEELIKVTHKLFIIYVLNRV